MIKLYHFPHCPYCIRVRFVLGYLNIPYESIVSRYEDTKLRLSLSGDTTTPFVILDNGDVIRDSLAIIEAMDPRHSLGFQEFKSSPEYEKIKSLIDQLSNVIHPITWPFWVYTPEFDEVSRQYTISKKQKQRGSFAELFHKKEEHLKKVQPILDHIQDNLRPFYQNADMTIRDILLAAHLWGLYIVPEFQFSSKIHDYLQEVKKRCRFNYQQDFWK